MTGAILHGPRKQYFEKYLPAFTHLRVVANFGAGTNHIDLKRLADLASARNIVLGKEIRLVLFGGRLNVKCRGATVTWCKRGHLV